MFSFGLMKIMSQFMCILQKGVLFLTQQRYVTSSGGCIVANNNGKIPTKDLKELLEIISAQYFFICRAWREHFKVEKISFYA